MTSFETLRISDPRAGVRLVQLDRPKQLNALSSQVLAEIEAALDAAGADEAVRVVVITGDQRAFAAGADLNELAQRDLAAIVRDRRPRHWEAIRRFPKPLIAAVDGFALGGGCELAMHADIIIAGRRARFGQPEINLGLIPGAGGTQRLTRAVGKSLAMKLVLSGAQIDAETALARGLVAEVTEPELTVERALDLAAEIAQKPAMAVRMAKEAVLKAFETTLEAGLDYERRAYHLLFGTEDKAEGVRAFIDKRKPDYKGR